MNKMTKDKIQDGVAVLLEHASFRYANSDFSAVKDVSLTIQKGEAVLLCGESGCGKTTLTRLINGLIPQYYEGEFSGDVRVCGLDVAKAELYETARIVGSVFQNPRSQFFCVDVTSEIAFGCENFGMPEETVRTRIAETADEIGIEDLLGENIFHLSGGQKQKVACASVAAVRPDVFVLDEPTSNLDVATIRRLAQILRHWKAQGKTIVIAEHRLGWLKDVCDRVVYLRDGEIAMDCAMGDFLQIPSEELAAMGLRTMTACKAKQTMPKNNMAGTIDIQNCRVAYGNGRPALKIDGLSLPKGDVIAVIGDNGAGKTTLARCICGLEKRSAGCVCYGGKRCKRRELLKTSYLVMQDVNHQLFCESVSDEVRLGMDEANEPLVDGTLAALNLTTLSDRHPMSLSGGQKQRVAVAAALLAGKQTLIFDEPTSGLDLRHMRETARLISHTRGKCTSIVVTHDSELILLCCTHVLHLEEGRMRAFYALDGEGRQKLEQYFRTNDKPNGKEEEQIGRKEPGRKEETVEFETTVCICGES